MCAGRALISSIRLSECLYVMLVIGAVCALAYCLRWQRGMGRRVTLTFVLLLDVCVAQAHQAHLEAQNPHFAVPSAGGGDTE